MIIRDAQVKTLEQIPFETFVDELCSHCREYAPELTSSLNDEQLEVAVREGIKRAEKHGFDLQGPVRFYVEMMIAFGSGFDTDSQYPWAKEALDTDTDAPQIERAERLFAAASGKFPELFGEDNKNARGAMERLLELMGADLDLQSSGFKEKIFGLLQDAYPQKVQCIGEEAVKALISEGVKISRNRYGFKEPRHRALIVVLMFALGHSFDSDPFHLWLSSFFEREKESVPERRAKALEERMRIWFEAASNKSQEKT